MSQCYNDFIAIIENPGSKNDKCLEILVWLFFHDSVAHVGLYLAIHGGAWSLRMKILPQHFAEVLCLPGNIRHCLEKGGFVCNIREYQDACITSA